MFFRRSVISSQGSSLANAMTAASHVYGDTSQLVLEGVGVESDPDGVCIFFCPARITEHSLVSQAKSADHQSSLPGNVRLSRRSVRELRQVFVSPFSGFATIACDIRSNGCLQMDNVQVSKVEAYDGTLDYADSYLMLQQAG